MTLTLERLAANVIRTSLQPNAVVGVKILVENRKLPPHFAEFLTLGLTKENVNAENGILEDIPIIPETRSEIAFAHFWNLLRNENE